MNESQWKIPKRFSIKLRVKYEPVMVGFRIRSMAGLYGLEINRSQWKVPIRIEKPEYVCRWGICWGFVLTAFTDVAIHI